MNLKTKRSLRSKAVSWIFSALESNTPEDETKIKLCLAILTKVGTPRQAVCAELALSAFQSSMRTDPSKTPRLWKMRFQRFLNLVTECHSSKAVTARTVKSSHA